jgi:hypothetical protein
MHHAAFAICFRYSVGKDGKIFAVFFSFSDSKVEKINDVCACAHIRLDGDISDDQYKYLFF